MIDCGKRDILGVGISVIDYDGAVERIVEAAKQRQALTVTALAVHGVMTGVFDTQHRARLNEIDLVVPDGQPVRWALYFLHRTRLRERVYGPELTRQLCEAAAREGLAVFLYGSRPEVLDALERNLNRRIPGLRIVGRRPSAFRRLSRDEQETIAAAIRSSGAHITLVGLGCPRQEVWVFENAPLIGMPAIAVGAAFDFHAHLLRQAPPTMQRFGLEWLFRLLVEPRRLWRRYLLLNPLYLLLLAAQLARLWHPRPPPPGLHPDHMRYG